MDLLTKEKSRQKRKGVNNQNNSIELFPVINTALHHHKNNKNQLRKDQ
jgi:Na+-transporting methylmalonyl-CoA/oxaloacetate decarboxylase gamma subunit